MRDIWRYGVYYSTNVIVCYVIVFMTMVSRASYNLANPCFLFCIILDFMRLYVSRLSELSSSPVTNSLLIFITMYIYIIY
jgi:hypothetical protein